MHKLKGYLPFLLVMILLGLVLLFPSFSFTYIFQPIAVLFWAAWRMLLSVNQNVYWLLLLILCGLLLGCALMPEKKTVSHPAYDYKTSPPDRVEYWRTMIQKTTPGEGRNAALRDSLQELVISMLALSRHSQPGDLRNLLASGQLSLPPEVKQYLLPDEEGHKIIPAFKRLQSLADWLSNITKQRKISQEQASVEAVLLWMENFLEMENER